MIPPIKYALLFSFEKKNKLGYFFLTLRKKVIIAFNMVTFFVLIFILIQYWIESATVNERYTVYSLYCLSFLLPTQENGLAFVC